MKLIRSKHFANGTVHLLQTKDGYPVETTDTFLPSHTELAAELGDNQLKTTDLGSRAQRWMIGVSVASGCPVRCKFCATGALRKTRNLTADEIGEQIAFVLSQNPTLAPWASHEFKINYTRMGDAFLNADAVREVIRRVSAVLPSTHHYVSTIGIKDADYSWIKGNITLQLSLHSLDEARRTALIPYNRKVSIEELGKIRTNSNRKTTVNLTLVDPADFDIEKLHRYFDPEHFFIKLSPINPNECSDRNGMNEGVIQAQNLL